MKEQTKNISCIHRSGCRKPEACREAGHCTSPLSTTVATAQQSHAEFLRSLAQNDHMIDQHYLESGASLNEIAAMIEAGAPPTPLRDSRRTNPADFLRSLARNDHMVDGDYLECGARLNEVAAMIEAPYIQFIGEPR